MDTQQKEVCLAILEKIGNGISLGEAITLIQTILTTK